MPFEDILAAEVSDHNVNCVSVACCEQVCPFLGLVGSAPLLSSTIDARCPHYASAIGLQVHGLVVYAIRRTKRRKYLWRQTRIFLASPVIGPPFSCVKRSTVLHAMTPALALQGPCSC